MNTPVLQWIRKHAKNIIKNTVRPHITAIWTPLTRKRGCGRVVRHRRPGKDSRSRAWVRIPRAALFRSLMMRFRQLWKIDKNDQNQRKFIFYFSELRGRGKSSARISKVKLTHLHILFFFRNLKMRLRHASFKNFHKKSTSKYMNRKKPYQKNGVFSKFWKINDDVKATQSMLIAMKFGGAAWLGWPGWLAWLGWLAGWLACRLWFLVLIVKVIYISIRFVWSDFW